MTLEFLNKVTFSDHEYYFFLNEEVAFNPIEEQFSPSNDHLLNNKILKILITFLENKLAAWTSPQYKLVRNSATNLVSNLMRKFWLSSENPQKMIEKLVAAFFVRVYMIREFI